MCTIYTLNDHKLHISPDKIQSMVIPNLLSATNMPDLGFIFLAQIKLIAVFQCLSGPKVLGSVSKPGYKLICFHMNALKSCRSALCHSPKA